MLSWLKKSSYSCKTCGKDLAHYNKDFVDYKGYKIKNHQSINNISAQQMMNPAFMQGRVNITPTISVSDINQTKPGNLHLYETIQNAEIIPFCTNKCSLSYSKNNDYVFLYTDPTIQYSVRCITPHTVSVNQGLNNKDVYRGLSIPSGQRAEYRAQQTNFNTKRLLIRDVKSSDAEALFAIYGDKKTMEQFDSHNEPVTNSKQLIDSINNIIRDNLPYWVICLNNKPEQAIGFCNINYKRDEKRQYIEFALQSKHRGHGLMSEVLFPVFDFCKEMGISEVFAMNELTNAPSDKLLQNFGFINLGPIPATSQSKQLLSLRNLYIKNIR